MAGVRARFCVLVNASSNCRLNSDVKNEWLWNEIAIRAEEESRLSE